MDHIAWKLNVYQTLLGLAPVNREAFTDHRQCALGQWYYEGEGQRLYSHCSSYRSLEACHRSFHEQGCAALDALQQGHREDAIRLLGRMEKDSELLLQTLGRLGLEIEQITGSS